MVSLQLFLICVWSVTELYAGKLNKIDFDRLNTSI